MDSIDNETRRRFSPPFAPSLFLINALPVHPLHISPDTNKIWYLFESLNGALLESSSSLAPMSSSSAALSSHQIQSPLSASLAKRNSRLTRSFQGKHAVRRVTRMKRQQTAMTGEHATGVVLVENEVVFQQLLKECTSKVSRAESETPVAIGLDLFLDETHGHREDVRHRSRFVVDEECRIIVDGQPGRERVDCRLLRSSRTNLVSWPSSEA
jgi:hypothetical protein